VNSTRPITFVEAPKAASAAFAVAALAVAFLGLAQANAAFRDGAARDSLARAEAMPRGMERDAALTRALIAIDDAVKAAPQNGATHALKARAYYLQATTAAVDEISAPLLAAARASAQASAERSPGNAGAAAIVALAAAAGKGADDREAASAVANAYARPASGDAAAWRLEAAVRTWRALDVGMQQMVLADACQQAAHDRAFAAILALVAPAIPDSGLGRCEGGAPAL
jgi:hypothetical protein